MNNFQIHSSSIQIKRTVAVYNMVPNVLWSVINLTPIFIFCYLYMHVKVVYIFSAVSLLPLMFPRRFFDNLLLSTTASAYKKMGVKLINKFTQNGYLINGLIRKKFPDYSVISPGSQSQKKVLQQTYLFEKFHFAMFVFFMSATVSSLLQNKLWWALAIAVTNLVYNVYPIFLQQYIRLRLKSFNKRIKAQRKSVISAQLQ